MADREKLIELLESLCVDYGAMAIFFTSGEAEVLADHLITNGVTVRERGQKVTVERHRGVTRYIPCPYCSHAVPSNKPYTEKVEYCSVCGKKLDDTFQNFCPNCGADMRGEEDGT